MAEIVNNNVFDTTKKFVDFAGLDYFWDKAKAYVDGVDSAMQARVKANEDAIALINQELESLSGGAGSIQTQINTAIEAEVARANAAYDAKGAAEAAETAAKSHAETKASAAETAAKAYADGLAVNYDAKGAAADAEAAAKSYADGKLTEAKTYASEQAAGVQGNLNTHEADAVKHITADERAAWNAAKTSIDAFMADASVGQEAIDTLKELQSFIGAEGEAAASLVSRVGALEASKDAYVDADVVLKGQLESYADQAEADAKLYADGLNGAMNTRVEALEAIDHDHENKGVLDGITAVKVSNWDNAETNAVATAKSYTDGEITKAKTYAEEKANAALASANSSTDTKLTEYSKTTAMNSAIAEAKAAAIKDASDNLANLVANLKSAAYVEVATLESTMDSKDATNLAAAKTYASTYTDALFNSVQFATNGEIDSIFA